MISSIYKNEESWRGHMLLWQTGTRDVLLELKATIIALFVLYLVAVYYSPLVSGVIAGAMFIGVALQIRKHRKTSGRLLDVIKTDPDLEV
jgi:polyferredoxin